jgi:hypothetical protein
MPKVIQYNFLIQARFLAEGDIVNVPDVATVTELLRARLSTGQAEFPPDCGFNLKYLPVVKGPEPGAIFAPVLPETTLAGRMAIFARPPWLFLWLGFWVLVGLAGARAAFAFFRWWGAR